MRLSRSIALFFALALSCSGCTEINGPLSFSERREIANARSRWNSSPARAAYEYDLRLSCFCPTEVTKWNTVTVIEGVITGVRTDSGVAVPRDQWRFFSTVDDLFATLEVTSRDELRDIVVRFDAKDGYPAELTFTYSKNVLDAGISYFTRNLRAVARGGGN